VLIRVVSLIRRRVAAARRMLAEDRSSRVVDEWLDGGEDVMIAELFTGPSETSTGPTADGERVQRTFEAP
jgi:hypothetical protein